MLGRGTSRWGRVLRYFGITALCALLWLSAPAKADIVVNISKSQQRLAVTVDGTEQYRWPVSTGRRGHVTQSGTFHPTRLERHWYSHQYQMTPMPRAMFFFRGYAVHGTMEAYNLGHVASHGCVRLRPDHAATLFKLVHKRRLADTRIVVRDGLLPPIPGAVPMADASPDAKPPKAAEVAEQHLASAPEDANAVDVAIDAKTHRDLAALRGNDVEVALAAHARAEAPPARVERAAPNLTLARGDEAAVLRSRQAWLNGLAHKYGFNSW